MLSNGSVSGKRSINPRGIARAVCMTWFCMETLPGSCPRGLRKASRASAGRLCPIPAHPL